MTAEPEVVLRVKTAVRLRGKPVWILWFDGQKLVTTEDQKIFESKIWTKHKELSSRFKVITRNDDGRGAAWVKQEIRKGLIK